METERLGRLSPKQGGPGDWRTQERKGEYNACREINIVC